VVRLKYAAHINRSVLAESTASTFEFAYIDIGSVSDLGTIRIPAETTTFSAAPSRARRLAPPGATIVSTVRTYLRAIARVPPATMPLVFSTGFATLEARPDVDPGFLSYVCRSEPFIEAIVARSTGASYPAISPSDLADIDVQIPVLDQQRRIAAFLDTAVARIDRLRAHRADQQRTLEERLDRLVSAVIGGEAAALAALGYPEGASAWTPSRISRVCDIQPGYSFPSEGFVGEGVRLLRGINVAVGGLDWAETAHWDSAALPIPRRFHLEPDDLVLAMDRPWIGGGMRLAVVTSTDLPSLLVQRVARLRATADVELPYIRWALSSHHFRGAVEAELTGVSVPHLSADQIGGFAIRLPPPPTQRRLAEALDMQASLTRQLIYAIDAQSAALAERRQALITAAVSGHIDAPVRP
jgi:type I restriction enzyme, S subunit